VARVLELSKKKVKAAPARVVKVIATKVSSPAPKIASPKPTPKPRALAPTLAAPAAAEPAKSKPGLFARIMYGVE
jgi:hypothetical protein